MSKKEAKQKPLVSVIMGSTSDWEVMQRCAQMLQQLGIPFEAKVMSAHRTLDYTVNYIRAAEGRGIRIIIAGAGGAAHLGGVAAGATHLPVLAVPMPSKLNGIDSLLSMVQMPAGIPVPTLAVGNAGATNAALTAAAILALTDKKLRARLLKYREQQAEKVMQAKLPPV